VFLQRLLNPHNLPVLCALLLLLASVSMSPLDIAQPVHDIQVTFDISQSMNVEDVVLDQSATSRLTLAKTAARALLLDLPCGSRVGWGVFSGHRVITLITPLEVCSHYAGLLASLEKIDGRMRWEEASNIGKGLHQGIRATQTLGGGINVVFISDGHEAPPLREGKTGMPATRGFNLDGLLVGVGGDTPAPIPKTDAAGRVTGFWQAEEVVQQSNLPAGQSHEELSRLHADHLIRLAQLANLTYVKLDSVHAIARAIEDVGFSNTKSVPIDLRWLPAGLALLALCWRFLPFGGRGPGS
jgi:mxaL protein